MRPSIIAMALAALMLGASGAFAQCDRDPVGNITEISDPPLDLFAEAKQKTLLESFEAAKVPIPICKVAKNRALRVEVEGITGWVDPAFVETDLPVETVVGVCDTVSGNTQIAATRSLGEGCRQ